MTRQQRKAILAIQSRIESGEKFTYEWLASELGIVSKGRAYETVSALCERGYLVRVGRKLEIKHRVDPIVEWMTYDQTTREWTTIHRGHEWTGNLRPTGKVA